jgi:hypothetical protein
VFEHVAFKPVTFNALSRSSQYHRIEVWFDAINMSLMARARARQAFTPNWSRFPPATLIFDSTNC